MTIVCIKAPKFLGAILKLFVKKKRKTEESHWLYFFCKQKKTVIK